MTADDRRRVTAGLIAGRADAWAALYDATAAPLWRYVGRRMPPCGADVADLVQEIFTAAATGARKLSPDADPWPWLIGIARRKVALFYRRRDQRDRLQRAAEQVAACEPALSRWLNGGESPPPEVAASAELTLVVRATLAGLPEETDSLLTAFYLDNEPVDQLAKRLGMTPLAVRSKLARAREAFRAAFLARHPHPVAEAAYDAG